MEIRVIKSDRRSMAIEVKGPQLVLVRVPLACTEAQVREFVQRNRLWINQHLQTAAQREREAAQLPVIDDEKKAQLKREAEKQLPQRVSMIAGRMGVSYSKISFRCMKGRWGSCSREGHLSLNILLMLCPEKCIDYVIVHELCHRFEMNHSAAFWQYVSAVMPDWRQAEAWLKREGTKLIRAAYPQQ